MFGITGRTLRRSVGLLLFLGAALWGNYASAQTVVPVQVYKGTELLASESLKFGLSSAADVVKPPPPPTGSGVRLSFKKASYDWSEDYRPLDSNSEVWTLSVSIPDTVSEQIFIALDGTAFGAIGSLVLNGSGQSDTDITGDFTTNRLIVRNGTYTITFARVTTGTFTGGCRDFSNNSFGHWRLDVEESGVWHEDGEILGDDDGEPELTVGTMYTVSFEPVDGYVTPADFSFTMSTEGKSHIGVYKKEDVNSFKVTYTFEGAAIPETAAPSTLWSIYPVVDGVADLAKPYQEQSLTTFLGDVPEIEQVGTVLNDLPIGEWEVQFRSVEGASEAWTTPAPQRVTVEPEDTISLTGNYVLTPGEVVIDPSAVTLIEGGATFDIDFSLSSAPTGDVVVSVTPESGFEGIVTIDPAEFTITKDGDLSQTITITSTEVTEHKKFGLNFSANGPANDPRYDLVSDKSVAVTVIDEDVTVPGDVNLTVVPDPSLDFTTVVVGEAVTRYVLITNGAGDPEDVELVFTGAEGEFSVEESTFTISAGETVAVPVTVNAESVGLLTEKLLVLASDRTGKPIAAQRDIAAQVGNPTDPSALLFFEPGVVVAKPAEAEAGKVPVEFNVVVAFNDAVTAADDISLEVELPATLSNIDFTNLNAGLGNTVPERAGQTVTFSYEGVISTTSDLTLFTITADATVTTPNVIDVIDITAFSMANGETAIDSFSQDGQLAISDAIQTATLNVNADEDQSGNEIVNINDIILIFRKVQLGRTASTGLVPSTITLPNGVTAEDVEANIDALVNSGLLNVNEDMNNNQDVININDIILIFRKVQLGRTAATGLVPSTITLPDGVTAEDVENNIIKILP